MRRVSRKRYLELFSERARAPIESHLCETGTIAAVCFENLDLSSSEFGMRSHLPVGPIWSTLRCLEDTEAMEPGRLGRPLGETPSRFRYPTWYWKRPTCEEDNQWEAAQDSWDEAHPVFPPVARDEDGADHFTETKLAAMRGPARQKGK